MQQSLAQELSRLVVEALVQIGLTERDVLGGAIEHTELPWQVPPLVIEAHLFGAALSEYFDRPTFVNLDHFINMYSDALADMRNAPAKVLNGEGFKQLYSALPRIKLAERQLYFAMPDGFPGGISDYAGASFALECAHILRTNAKLSEFVSDEDNYYAVLPDGMEVGVKDGVPSVWYEQWDLPVSGMVQEMLRQPRGTLWEGCDHDVIAKVRSVCHIYEKSLRDFEAVDWALQALRVIDGSRELLRAVRSLKAVAFERTSRMDALNYAVEVAGRLSITDRQRIETLKHALVPDILSITQFSKQIYGYYTTVPAVVSPKVLARIQQNVQALLDHETMLFARTNPAISRQT
jgi:hypothetical protein